MRTIHFVYSHGPQKSCPNAISTQLISRLQKAGYNVVKYPWDLMGSISPAEGDVLLGHPHSLPFTYFRASIEHKNWARKLILYPYAHGRLGHSSFIDSMLHHCDLFLAITGPYWFNDIPKSRLKHWLPKMRHLDLAVDREDFPFLKRSFNPKGKRRLVYIGGSITYKNTKYLEEIASCCPEMEFGWIGRGSHPPKGLTRHGYLNLQTGPAQEIVRDYDFLLTVGDCDPNPTTILESMAWGLLPVCTPQSGYQEIDGVVNVPLNDTASVADVLRRLQSTSEEELRGIQQSNLRRLVEYYNWDRFASQVIEAVESNLSPKLGRRSITERFGLLAHNHFASERSLIRPSVAKAFLTTAGRSLRHALGAERQ